MGIEQSDRGAGSWPWRRLAGAGLIIAVPVVLLVALVAFWLVPRSAQTIDRIERDHGIPLPASTGDIQAMGDLVRLVDHGRSAVFTIDAGDLPALRQRLDQVPDVGGSTFVPANQQYQPSGTPWPPDSSPSEVFAKTSPAGGDFMHVEIYPIDGSTVGVWLYSDWN